MESGSSEKCRNLKCIKEKNEMMETNEQVVGSWENIENGISQVADFR